MLVAGHAEPGFTCDGDDCPRNFARLFRLALSRYPGPRGACGEPIFRATAAGPTMERAGLIALSQTAEAPSRSAEFGWRTVSVGGTEKARRGVSP